MPEDRDKGQSNRRLRRHVQIPQRVFSVTALKEGEIPNCEVNRCGLPFGFVPDHMFDFVCGRSHHTNRNVLRDGEFVINISEADIGEAAERLRESVPG